MILSWNFLDTWQSFDDSPKVSCVTHQTKPSISRQPQSGHHHVTEGWHSLWSHHVHKQNEACTKQYSSTKESAAITY